MVKTQQSDFLKYEIWILTFGGGLQRSGVYADGVTDKNKSEFRDSVRNKISLIVNNKYKETSVTSDDHISNLIELKKWIDIKHSNVLANGFIKLCVVQKLLNLYLKYQWCLGLVKTPPHCPFDRIIISKMKLPNPPAWTKIDSVDSYKLLVESAEKLAGGKTIAEWELDVFARR